jgi:hypothetical protein
VIAKAASMSTHELEVLRIVALSSLLAWASGLRLYLVVFALGLAGYLGWFALPAGLDVLRHPYVIAAAGFMLTVEFFADKIPWLDRPARTSRRRGAGSP